jgi:hypothetical protein
VERRKRKLVAVVAGEEEEEVVAGEEEDEVVAGECCRKRKRQRMDVKLKAYVHGLELVSNGQQCHRILLVLVYYLPTVVEIKGTKCPTLN